MSIKAPLILAGGYLGATVIPTSMGYKDPEGSNKNRITAGVLGAATSALASSPKHALPRFARGPLLNRIGRTKYRKLNTAAPALGAAWGAPSAVASYEVGRLANTEKKASLEKLALKPGLLHLKPMLQEARNQGIKTVRTGKKDIPALSFELAVDNNIVKGLRNTNLLLPKITRGTSKHFNTEPKIRATIAHELGHAEGYRAAIGKPLAENSQTFKSYVHKQIDKHPNWTVPKHFSSAKLQATTLSEWDASSRGVDILKRHNLIKSGKDAKQINTVLSKAYNGYAASASAKKSYFLENKGQIRSYIAGFKEHLKTKRFDLK